MGIFIDVGADGVEDLGPAIREGEMIESPVKLEIESDITPLGASCFEPRA